MDEVASRYLTALDELNLLTSTSYYQAGGQDLAARVNQGLPPRTLTTP